MGRRGLRNIFGAACRKSPARSTIQCKAITNSLKETRYHAAELHDYFLLSAARADLLRRLNRRNEAADAYRRVLRLAGNNSARNFLSRRLAEMESPS